MKVLILGVNGFIGNALTHRILTTTDWEVFGLDMACDKLERSLGDPRFHYLLACAYSPEDRTGSDRQLAEALKINPRHVDSLHYLGVLAQQVGRNEAAVELIVHVLACLAEGLGIRATARVFEVEANTVLHWLVEAAEQLTAFSAYFLCDLHVKQLQLDELYAVLRDLKAGVLSEDEALKRLERSPYWVWTAMDPDSKLLLVIDVGSRTLAVAQRVVHQVTQVLAPGCVPLCLTDGLKDYTTALLTHFGQWMQPARRRDKGPLPKPRWVPVPALLYAQVVKSYRRRRIVGVTYRVGFGTLERLQQVLSACGRKINTAFVERLNLDIRQRVAAVGRRVNTLCQGEDGLRQQLAVYHVYYNFCLPHTSLRQPLLVPEPTNGSGSTKRWRPCTPAMAAGLTDHVWSLKEVLCYRVPPWPQPQTV